MHPLCTHACHVRFGAHGLLSQTKARLNLSCATLVCRCNSLGISTSTTIQAHATAQTKILPSHWSCQANIAKCSPIFAENCGPHFRFPFKSFFVCLDERVTATAANRLHMRVTIAGDVTRMCGAGACRCRAEYLRFSVSVSSSDGTEPTTERPSRQTTTTAHTG